MKKHRKKIIIVFTVLLVLIGGVIAAPFIFKDDIIRLIKTEINDNVNARVNFNEDISLSLIQSFPNLSVSIDDISVVGNEIFATDTLMSCKTLKTSINLSDLFRKDKLTLNSIVLNQPDIKLVTKDTLSNWDIFIESTDTSTSVSPGTDFNKVVINEGRFRYIDSLAGIETDVQGISATLNGKFYEDIFDVTTNFTTSSLLVGYEGIPYIDHLPIRGDAVISADLSKDEYLFKDNQFYTGDLLLLLSGGFKFINEDDMDFDLNFGTSKAQFKEFISLIPDLYRSDLKDFSATGLATVSGFFKGVYGETSFPGYELKVNIENGDLKYNALAESLKAINLALLVSNPDGITDHTIVDLKNLSFVMRNEPFKAHLLLKTPESDPYMDGAVTGKIKLKDFSDFIPQDQGILLQGDVKADLAFKGNYSAAKSQDLSKFQSSGNLVATGLAYKSPDLPQQINISMAELKFNQANVSMPTLKVDAGKSDLLMGGTFDNFFGYLLNDEILSGDFRLNSNQIRSSDFVMPEPESNSASNTSGSTSSELIQIPSNLALNITGNVGHLEYEDYKLDNANLNASLKNKILQIERFTTQFLGGNLNLTGQYNTSNPKDVFTDISLTAQDFDIATIFKRFETIRLLAPVAEYAQGKFSTTFKLNTKLLSDFSPDLRQISCSGILDLFNCDVKGLKAINELGSKFKSDAFTKPIKLVDLLLSFSIKDGTINLAPFNLPIGESVLRLEGSTTLDKKIDFKGLLTIPKKLYEANAKGYNSYIPQNKWVDLANSDFKDLLFDLNILGTFFKPEVKINFQNISKGIGDQIKDRVKDELDAQRKIAEDRARLELEKARAEADKMKSDAEAAAKKAIDEEKRKVDARIEQEKADAKKKLEDDLKKKAGDLLKKR